MIRPVIFVSKCIETCACRYDGQKVNSAFVAKLFKYADIKTECPETAIGLGIPRQTLRIVAYDKEMNDLHLFQPDTGTDYTEKMKQWAGQYLEELGTVDGFVMKSKSPSSGVRDVKIYSKGEKGMMLSKKGAGFFGGRISAYYPGIPVEDEARLLNASIRDHFLKSVYALSSFRNISEKGKAQDIVKFQEENKILFMSYGQNSVKKLGRIAATAGNNDLKKVCADYMEGLKSMFSAPPKVSNTVNAISHVFGYFKKGLSAAEKKYFIELLDKYQSGKANVFTVTAILRSYAVRFDEKYILSQTFFEPYPEELYGGD